MVVFVKYMLLIYGNGFHRIILLCDVISLAIFQAWKFHWIKEISLFVHGHDQLVDLNEFGQCKLGYGGNVNKFEIFFYY